jgi:hypothetical protein
MKIKDLLSLLIFPLSVCLLILSGGGAIIKDDQIGPDIGTIPDNLNEIFMRSCKPCHWEGGKFKALYHVNFSKWDNYSFSKQVKKAEKICSELQGEDMPPQSFRKSKPNLIPTDEQVDAVCKWASTLKNHK